MNDHEPTIRPGTRALRNRDEGDQTPGPMTYERPTISPTLLYGVLTLDECQLLLPLCW